jgi:hypothetical protein
MLICPMCKKEVAESASACPRCRTDLSILKTYLGDLESGLERAQSLTRAGELGEAVFAYLEVLEVDPDNEQARKQVGRVASAVRQFDRVAVGRRWLRWVQRRAHLHHWLRSLRARVPNSWRLAQMLLLVTIGFILGYLLGSLSATTP